jgi:hypothetical protein
MEGITKALLERYGFESEWALVSWGQRMEATDWKYSENESAVLYTDGDGGIAEITYSEMFDEKGFAIRPINCFYVDFLMSDLEYIYKELREEWEYAYEQAE